MLEPARTGFGEAVFVTDWSAAVATLTTVCTVAVLLESVGSLVPEVTEATSVTIVPFVVPAPTFTTRVYEALPPFVKSGFVQVIAPVPPTAGVTHVHPATVESDTNVVFAGTCSVKLAFTESCGPLLVITCV